MKKLILLLLICTNSYAYNYEIISEPDTWSTSLSGINDFGDVVGEYSTLNGVLVTTGFKLSSGVKTELTHNCTVHPLDINNAGVIVGRLGCGQAFYYNGGFIERSYPGAVITRLNTINNLGVAGGMAQILSIGSFGVEYRNGVLYKGDGPIVSMSDSSTLSDVYSDSTGIYLLNYILKKPQAINDIGQIVGEGYVHDSSMGMSIEVINCPGSSYTIATDINNHGVIVGWCVISGVTVGFVATPETPPVASDLTLSPLLTKYTPPSDPGPDLPIVDEDGNPDINPPNIEIQIEFDEPVSGLIQIPYESDDEVIVHKVELFINGFKKSEQVILQQDIKSSFEFDTSILPSGTHEITLRARDGVPNISESTIEITLL